jgi:RHS repeat-associated protein
VQESGASGVVAYLRSLNIDEPFVRQSSSNEYYHADALGSVLALTGQTGASQTTYSYEAFGKTTITGASSNPFQYTGRENDGTGLYYYRARYYSPLLHRFILEDPVELAGQQLDLYAYVGNTPTKFTDSTGLIVDTFLDLSFIIYDLYRLAADGRKGFDTNLLALAADAGGALIPGVTGLGVTVRLAKQTTPVAGKIAGFTREGINRAIERDIKPNQILDAVKNPLRDPRTKVDPAGRTSIEYVGREATVVLNPQGEVVTVHGTHSKLVRKLLGGTK